MIRNKQNLQKLIIWFLAIFMAVFLLFRSPKLVSAYEGFIDDAIKPAQASQLETGVPASVTIAQAILESEWGDKHIGDANNYFGIKCYRRNDGSLYFGEIATGCVEVETQEWNGTSYITVKSPFRSYKSMADSFRDHGYFFVDNPRYKMALLYKDDPDQFAREIHRAGYATSPTYSDNLISLMKKYNLYQYDVISPVDVSPPPDNESNNGQTEQPKESRLEEKWAELNNTIKTWWDGQIQKLQTWWNNQTEKLKTWWTKQLRDIQHSLEQWVREQWEAFWRKLEAQIVIWLQQCLGSGAMLFLPLFVYLLNKKKSIL